MKATHDQRAVAGTIVEPGVYDLPAAAYHSDPVQGRSLSSSGAKKLLRPGCPALFKAWRDGVQEHREVFDFGRAAHARVLGVGDPVVVLDFDDWKTKAAREARDEAYAAGSTPILAEQDAQIEAMATELNAHPIASNLLDPTAGRPEQTLIWRDRETGVMCRAMLDQLRDPAPGQRLIIADYKTAAEVDPESIAKAMANYAYHCQAAWYVDGAEELGLSPVGQPAYVLVFQRKTAPHLVVCAQVHPDDIGRGHERNRAARHLYRWCVEHNTWPGYADDRVLPIQLPIWEQSRHDGASERGDFEPRGVIPQ